MPSPSSNKQQGPFSHFEHKVALLLIFVLGFGGLILGVKYVGKGLQVPFYDILYYDGEQFLTANEEEEAETQRLRETDTDEDGISDYNELYVYETSPYLNDSDSDGYSDYQEVFSGNDPNCPTGQDCGFYFASADAAGPGVSAEEFIEGVPNSGITPPTEVTFETEADVFDYFGQMSVEQIRETLIMAGASEEMVNAMDDETLVGLFNEALSEAGDTGDLIDSVEEEAASEETTE